MALYEAAYLVDSGFERQQIAARQRQALEILGEESPRVVLEIGCGTDPLYREAIRLAHAPQRWVIVEPGDEFVRIAERSRLPELDLRVVHGFFEEKVGEVVAACGGSPDLTLCLGVLQSVERPDEWLRLVRRTLAPGATLVVGVANALSFHRRLARQMGLIEDEHELSERDRRGFHERVFDMSDLSSLMEDAGFSVERAGGYLVKPFTHAQMDLIADVLTPEVLDGLWRMGQAMPELASEIYVVARAV